MDELSIQSQMRNRIKYFLLAHFQKELFKRVYEKKTSGYKLAGLEIINSF